MDDIDYWLDVEEGLNEDAPGTVGNKRPLQEIDTNASTTAGPHTSGGKRLKPAADCFPDEDELLSYMEAEPAHAQTTANHPESNTSAPEPGGAEATKQLEPSGREAAGHEWRGGDPCWYPEASPADEEVDEADREETLWPCRNPLDIEGDVMPVTGSSGARVYCSLRPPPGTSASVPVRGRSGFLLSRPWSEMEEDQRNRLFERLIREEEAKEREQEAKERRLQQSAAQEEASMSEGPAPAALWVDKYCPQSFLDLLSDEQINREVVRWVKSWDACVFQMTPGGQPGLAPQRSFKPELRPEHKVLLLCGAPGLGKTTLAHVVAKHCNYRPMEINASDSRSAEGLHNWLTDAAQTHSVTGDRRPNCIILDEVDGATGGAEGRSTIAALLKLATAGAGKAEHPKKSASRSERAAAADDGDSDGPDDDSAPGNPKLGGKAAGRKRKSVTRPLCRPVIAICNNLYAPALRPLRAIAKIVQFKTPTVERISSRLRVICATEGLVVDRQALNALVELTRSDVRACLNALQFLSRRTNRVTLRAINSLGIASKDVTESAFTVWTQLLTTRRQRGEGGAGPGGEASRLMNMLQDLGDDDLVLGGLHENMLMGRYMDTHMTRTAAAATHLAHADVLMRRCGQEGDFSLMRYLPASALCVRSCVAGPTRPQLRWPKQQGEAYRRRTANSELLHTWHLDVHPTLRSSLGITAAVQDVLPALMHIVCRPMRPVAVRLLSPEERSGLYSLVATMADYAIAFDSSPSFTPGADAGALALTPPLHTICCFPGMAQTHRAPPLPTQQVITHELQLETIRRREQAREVAGKQGASGVQDRAAGEGVSPTQEVSTPAAKPHLLTVAQRAKEAKTDKVVKPARKGNWLEQMQGRAAASKKPQLPDRQTESGSAGTAHRHWPVLYKFSQGYTNAVRRTVRMKDLL